MGDERVSAVADAGPLIHLAELNLLSLLTVFSALHVPSAVWAETVERKRISSELLLSLGNVQRHSLASSAIDRFVNQAGLHALHAGECECLYMCHHVGISHILTDDLAVRDAAKKLNVVPVGSLGIIIRAYTDGRLSLDEAKSYLYALYEKNGLFVTRTIVELAVEQVERLESS